MKFRDIFIESLKSLTVTPMFHLRKFFYDNRGNFGGEKRGLNELKHFFWIYIDIKRVSNPKNL